jgi:hypothetical protein
LVWLDDKVEASNSSERLLSSFLFVELTKIIANEGIFGKVILESTHFNSFVSRILVFILLTDILSQLKVVLNLVGIISSFSQSPLQKSLEGMVGVQQRFCHSKLLGDDLVKVHTKQLEHHKADVKVGNAVLHFFWNGRKGIQALIRRALDEHNIKDPPKSERSVHPHSVRQFSRKLIHSHIKTHPNEGGPD